jgi:hypothetical protein
MNLTSFVRKFSHESNFEVLKVPVPCECKGYRKPTSQTACAIGNLAPEQSELLAKNRCATIIQARLQDGQHHLTERIEIALVE